MLKKIILLLIAAFAMAGCTTDPNSWWHRPIVNINGLDKFRVKGMENTVGKDCTTLGECWKILAEGNPQPADFTIYDSDPYWGIKRGKTIRDEMFKIGIKVAIGMPDKYVVLPPRELEPNTFYIIEDLDTTKRVFNVRVVSDKLEKVFSDASLIKINTDITEWLKKEMTTTKNLTHLK